MIPIKTGRLEFSSMTRYGPI